MSRKNPKPLPEQALARIGAIHEQIARLELLCSGTLVKRRKLCGKPSCRCLRDPRARHGPYYEWGFMKGGKQVHRMVSAEQAGTLRKAIANYRTVRRLLRRWETESVRILEAVKQPKR